MVGSSTHVVENSIHACSMLRATIIELFNATRIEAIASSTKLFRINSNLMKLVYDALSSQWHGWLPGLIPLTDMQYHAYTTLCGCGVHGLISIP